MSLQICSSAGATVGLTVVVVVVLTGGNSVVVIGCWHTDGGRMVVVGVGFGWFLHGQSGLLTVGSVAVTYWGT